MVLVLVVKPTNTHFDFIVVTIADQPRTELHHMVVVTLTTAVIAHENQLPTSFAVILQVVEKDANCYISPLVRDLTLFQEIHDLKFNRGHFRQRR